MVTPQSNASGIIAATGINDLLVRLDNLEKRDRKVGIIASTAIAAILLFALLFWFAQAGFTMGMQSPQWETVSLFSPTADFGTTEEASGNTDASQSKAPAQAVNPGLLANKADAERALVQEEVSTIRANVAGDSNKTKRAQVIQPNKPQDVQPDDQYHVGNEGDPAKRYGYDAGTQGGLKYAWGPELTAGHRLALKTEMTGYDVQLEEKINFEITIDPSGNVVFVKAPFAIHPELVEIGKRNILQWKFSESDPAAGNLKTSVKITFRLN